MLCGIGNKIFVQTIRSYRLNHYKDFKFSPLAFQMKVCKRITYSYIEVRQCDIVNFCIKLTQTRKMGSYMTKGECEQN